MRWLRGIWAWLRASASHLRAHPAHLVIVLCALGVGAIAGIPAGQGGFHYVWRDPHFCNDCHVHDYADEAYFRSVHADVTTCHDCHRVPIMHYPRNLVLTPGMYGSEEELPYRPHVEEVICAACHTRDHGGEGHELTGPMTEDVLVRVVKIDASPLHRIHLDASTSDPGVGRGGGHSDDTDTDGEEGHGAVHTDGPVTCMDCHGGPSNRAHQFPANRDNCLQCHEAISSSAGRLSDLQCHECHFEGFIGSVD